MVLVATLDEVPPGERKIIKHKGIEIGIFNIEGQIHAVLNRCPHMGAPLCMGKIQQEVKSEMPGTYHFQKGAVLRCPWHRWEFRMSDGRCITSPEARVKLFETHIENGKIFLRV